MVVLQFGIPLPGPLSVLEPEPAQTGVFGDRLPREVIGRIGSYLRPDMYAEGDAVMCAELNGESYDDTICAIPLMLVNAESLHLDDVQKSRILAAVVDDACALSQIGRFPTIKGLLDGTMYRLFKLLVVLEILSNVPLVQASGPFLKNVYTLFSALWASSFAQLSASVWGLYCLLTSCYRYILSNLVDIQGRYMEYCDDLSWWFLDPHPLPWLTQKCPSFIGSCYTTYFKPGEILSRFEVDSLLDTIRIVTMMAGPVVLLLCLLVVYLVWRTYLLVHRRVSVWLLLRSVKYTMPSLSLPNASRFWGQQTVNFEMAVDGSVPYKARHLSGLMLLLQEIDTDGDIKLEPVGLAFRVKDYFITAKHVLDVASNRVGDLYVCGFSDKKNKSVPDTKSAQRVDFNNLESLVSEEEGTEFDLSVYNFGSNFFSKLGVGNVPLGVCLWGSSVNTYGLIGDPVLKTATGSVLRGKRDGPGRVLYSATTHRGWSGGPILVNRKVVAMHQCRKGENNEGLNIAYVEHVINRFEERKLEDTPDFYWDEVSQVVRNYWGDEVESEYMSTGVYQLTCKRTGRMTYEEREDLEDWKDRVVVDVGYKGYNPVYESADPENPISLDDTTPVVRSAKKGCVEFVFTEESKLQLEVRKSNQRHPPKSKKEDPRVVSALDFESAQEIGYDSSKFKFPDYSDPDETRRKVRVSLSKHLAKYVDRVSRVEKPPQELIEKAINIVIDMCKYNKYLMVKDPKSKVNIDAIIGSSRVDSSKSPGYPYLDEGYNTNGEVIAAGGLSERVIRSGTECSPSNMIGKDDATKAAKIDSEMGRLIHGVGLNDQVKTHAYFGAFNDALMANYRRSPIMVGWSPLKPTDGAWMFNELGRGGKKRKVCVDDVKEWDYSMHQFVAEAVAEIIVSLAMRPTTMTEEEAVQWRVEAKAQFLQQLSLPMRLPDGTIVSRLEAVLMTSGSVITIGGNSVAMLFMDTLVKLIMGYSPLEIKRDFIVKAGGDDKIQSAPIEFDHKEYCRIFGTLGVDVHGVEEFPSMVGADFFSWKFGGDNVNVTWTPTRFSKHVHTLRRTKLEDLPGTLIAHMRNWAHSEKEFGWFHDQYVKFNSLDKGLFPLADVVSRFDITNYLSGLERTVPAAARFTFVDSLLDGMVA